MQIVIVSVIVVLNGGCWVKWKLNSCQVCVMQLFIVVYMKLVNSGILFRCSIDGFGYVYEFMVVLNSFINVLILWNSVMIFVFFWFFSLVVSSMIWIFSVDSVRKLQCDSVMCVGYQCQFVISRVIIKLLNRQVEVCLSLKQMNLCISMFGQFSCCVCCVNLVFS